MRRLQGVLVLLFHLISLILVVLVLLLLHVKRFANCHVLSEPVSFCVLRLLTLFLTLLFLVCSLHLVLLVVSLVRHEVSLLLRIILLSHSCGWQFNCVILVLHFWVVSRLRLPLFPHNTRVLLFRPNFCLRRPIHHALIVILGVYTCPNGPFSASRNHLWYAINWLVPWKTTIVSHAWSINCIWSGVLQFVTGLSSAASLAILVRRRTAFTDFGNHAGRLLLINHSLEVTWILSSHLIWLDGDASVGVSPRVIVWRARRS